MIKYNNLRHNGGQKNISNKCHFKAVPQMPTQWIIGVNKDVMASSTNAAFISSSSNAVHSPALRSLVNLRSLFAAEENQNVNCNLSIVHSNDRGLKKESCSYRDPWQIISKKENVLTHAVLFQMCCYRQLSYIRETRIWQENLLGLAGRK